MSPKVNNDSHKKKKKKKQLFGEASQRGGRPSFIRGINNGPRLPRGAERPFMLPQHRSAVPQPRAPLRRQHKEVAPQQCERGATLKYK